MKGIRTWVRHAWWGLGVLGFLAGAWGPWARYPYLGTLVEEQRSPGTGEPVVGLVWTGFTNLEFHAQQTRSTGNTVVHRVGVWSRSPDGVLASNELSGIQGRPVQVVNDGTLKGAWIRWQLGVGFGVLGILMGLTARGWVESQGIRYLLTVLAAGLGVFWAGAAVWRNDESWETQRGRWVVWTLMAIGIAGAVFYWRKLRGKARWPVGDLLPNTEPASVPETPEQIISQTPPERTYPWENSLGQKFVPVPGTKVLFCIWQTRVKDFEAFVAATGYDAEKDMWSWNSQDKTKVGAEQWIQRGDTWRKPGWEQMGEHPVVGVNYDDAEAFCRWLTEKEQKEGRIGVGETYRLPTDAEWSLAVGATKYPWGNNLPPPAGAGNYAGEEFDEGWGRIAGYRDAYRRTSPVGKFEANRYGLYDLGGNVWEWVADWYRKEMNSAEAIQKYPSLGNDGAGKTYRVLRGASCNFGDPVSLESSFRVYDYPQIRHDHHGFRCVLGAEVAR